MNYFVIILPISLNLLLSKTLLYFKFMKTCQALKRALVTVVAYLTGYIGVFGVFTGHPRAALAWIIMLPNIILMSIIYFVSSLAKVRIEYTGLVSLITGGLVGCLVLYLIALMIGAGL